MLNLGVILTIVSKHSTVPPTTTKTIKFLPLKNTYYVYDNYNPPHTNQARCPITDVVQIPVQTNMATALQNRIRSKGMLDCSVARLQSA
jgi:hypothetical protein